MQKSDMHMPRALHEYLLSVSLREHEVLRLLREETSSRPDAIFQIPPEQGQFMALLVKIMGAKRTLEIGTYTGYSALSVALATPDDGITITCDINTEWTSVGQKFWRMAGVDDKIDLRIGPAMDTLGTLLEDGAAETFDFAFIDADKRNYDGYYEMSLKLLRSGGLIAIDNVLLFGSVVDPDLLGDELRALISDADIHAMRTLNDKILNDKRVGISMLALADGLTLAVKI